MYSCQEGVILVCISLAKQYLVILPHIEKCPDNASLQHKDMSPHKSWFFGVLIHS